MFTRISRHHFVGAVAAIFVLACLVPATLRAQNISTAELHGTVHDSSGAVIPNALIIIANPSKGFSRSTISDGEGNYQLLLLPPGTYVVTATATSFAQTDRQQRRAHRWRAGRAEAHPGRNGK